MRTTSRMCAAPRDSAEPSRGSAMAAAGFVPPRRCLDQDAHRRRSLTLCVTSPVQSVLHKYMPGADASGHRHGAAPRCRDASSVHARHVPCTMRASAACRSCRSAAWAMHRRMQQARNCRRSSELPAIAVPARRDRAAAAAADSRRFCGPRTPAYRRCSDSAKTTRTRSPTRRSAERWFARFPANDPLASSASVLAELGTLARARRAAHAAAARGGVPRRRRTREALREHADRAVHRAREPLSKIENQLWPALFDLTQGFLSCYAAFAREVSRPRAEQQVAGAAARAHRAPDRRTSASTRRSGSTATSSGSRRNGPSCTRCSRSRARGRSSASRWSPTPTATRRRSSTSTWSRCMLQLMNSGNMTRAPRRMGRRASSTSGAQPLRLTLEPSSVTSFYVDLGSRDGPAPPHAGAARGPRAVPRHAAAARAADAERRGARAEDPSQPLSDKTPRRSEQLALAHQARLAGRSRNSSRSRAAASARRPPARSTRSSASPRSPATCARRSSIPLPRARARQELRRHDGARGVRARAQRERPRASSRRGAGSRRTRRPAARGK